MLSILITAMSSVGLLFILLFPTEISELPPVNEIFKKIFNWNPNSFNSIVLMTLLTFTIPVLSYTIVLSNFSKFLFNSAKPIKKSFTSITFFFFLSSLIQMVFSILIFTSSITSSKKYYFLFSLSSFDTSISMALLESYCLVFSLIFNSFVFLILLFISETILSFKLLNVNCSFFNFLSKNLEMFMFIFFISSFYLYFLLKMEYSIMSSISENFMEMGGMSFSASSSIMINMPLMLMYTLLMTN